MLNGESIECFPHFYVVSGVLISSRLFLFSKWTVLIYTTKSAVLVCKGQSESVQLFD